MFVRRYGEVLEQMCNVPQIPVSERLVVVAVEIEDPVILYSSADAGILAPIDIVLSLDPIPAAEVLVRPIHGAIGAVKTGVISPSPVPKMLDDGHEIVPGVLVRNVFVIG